MSVFDELGLPDPSRQQAAPASVFAEFGLPEPIAQPPAGGLAAAAKQAIGAGIKGAGRAAADFIPGVTPANPISQYGQEVIDANPTAVQSFSDIADSPWTAVKEAVGNAGGSMAGMLGARALGTGITMAAPFTGTAAPLVGLAGQAIANVGPFVAAALPSYGGIREEQIKADPANAADAKSKAIAMLGAGAVGAIEGAFGPEAWALAAAKKGGIEAMVKKLADAKSIPAAIGKGIMRGGAIEGAEELVQNPIEQVAGYQDPTTRQAIGETLFGGAMGAIGGGVLGGGMGGFAKAMEPAQSPAAGATGSGGASVPVTPGSPSSTAPAIDPVADPLGTLTNPAAGIMSRTAATGEITGANEQKRQEQAIASAVAPITGTKNEGTQAGAQDYQGETGEPGPATVAAGAIAPTGLAGVATGAPAGAAGNLPAQPATVTPTQEPALPVTPAAPIVTDQQAEPAGDPTTPQGNQNGNQTEIPVAPEAGRSAQAEAGSGSGVAQKPEWAAFPKESGTLGIPRSEMPQIKAEHRGAMVNYMNARGVDHRQEEVPAASLRATQAEFSPAKVEKAAKFDGGDRSILISSDNHVLDGHHQWLAKLSAGESVKAIRLNAPIRQLVGLAHDFPSSTVAGGATPAPALQYPQQPTTGGGAIEQQPAPMSLGEYGKQKATTAASQSPVTPEQSPAKEMSAGNVGETLPKSETLVRIRTVYGDQVRVRQSDLDGTRTLIPTFSASGEKLIGKSIHRENLDPDGSKQQAINQQGVQDIIGADRDRKAFSTEAAAKRAAAKHGVTDTHAVVPASDVSPGTAGFVLRRKSAPVAANETAPDAPQAPLSSAEAPQASDDDRKADLLAQREALGKAAGRLAAVTPDIAGSAASVADAASRMKGAAGKSLAERRSHLEALRSRFVGGMEARRAQAEAQHIEGRTSEAATAPVVELALKKGARNSGADLRQEQEALLKQIDAAIAVAPADGDGFVTFDVPGDGKFKITNSKPRLTWFRSKIVASGKGFAPIPKPARHVAATERIQAGKASDQTIRDMLKDGDLTAALELSKVIGNPMVFGNYNRAKSAAPIPYTDAQPFAPVGFEAFGMVSAHGAGSGAWAVIETATGLSLGSGKTRAGAEQAATKMLANQSPQQLAETIAEHKARGEAKDQTTLEAEWVKWAEQEEYDKDHAAEIAEKAEKAKAAALAADRAKWEKLTGEKPDFAPGARNPLDPAYMNPVSVLEDYQKAKSNGKGDEYLDYAESKLDEEIAGHKPTIEAIRRIRSGSVGNWQYVGTQGAGGLPRYEKIVRTSDGREIRATIDGDISVYGFVREDNAIKSRIGDAAGSLTFQQAQEQADRAIAALMKPAKKDPALTKDIPETVKDVVSWNVTKLRDIEKSLEGVERARGKGHILALELRDRQQEISKAQEKLATFRQMAKDKGVDADGIIADLGGEPDFERFGKPAPADEPQSRIVTPDSLNLLTNPVANGDTIQFSDGEKWVAKEGWTGGPGAWTLLQGKKEHPTAAGVKGQAAFIRAIIDADEAAKAPPAWHTALPTEGLPITDDQRKSRGYELVVPAIAADAYDAITKTQMLAGGQMYGYYLPAADGRNGIARLLPDDQTPGKPWQMLGSEGLRVGMMGREQVVSKLAGWLRSEPVLGDTKAPKAEEKAPAKASPAAKSDSGKPAPGRYVAPSNKDNGATSQRIMADRAGVTATLTMLNNAVRKTNPDAAYADSEILNVATDRMDAVRDWLIASQKDAPAVAGYTGHPDSFAWAEKDVGGKVVYSHGDLALLEGFSPFGNPVYSGIKGDSRTSVDIESYTGKMFSDAEKAELLKARSEHIAEQDRLHATNPDGPFNGGARFAKTDGISAELAGVAQKWLSMLGIKSRVFLATKTDVSSAEAIDQYGLRGPFAAIRSAGVKREEDGGMRVLPNGDYYIILPPSNRQSAALETLAHEIGHLLEKEEWKSADQATKDAVMADYQKWLATAGNTSAKEWVTQLRAHTTGKQVGNIPNTTADKLPAYWRSFGEYFADQVSKWATTTDKPLTAVDAFFKRIALAMRRLYSMLAGKPYLPTDAMKKYLDSRSADAPLAPPAAKQSKSTASTSAANTEDAGSELTYNRRNRLNRGLKWADIADKDEALRVKEATKAKVYPKPDYKAMIGGGMAPQLAHIVKQVYDSISAAPQTRRSAAPSDDDIKNYIAGVNRVMDAVVGWANDADRGGKWLAYTVESSLRAYGGARSLIAAAGNNDVGQSLLSIAFPDGYEPVKNELIAIGGNKVYGALQPHSRELQDAIKDIKAGWPEPQESWQRQGFSIINGDGVKADPVAGDYGRLSVTVRMTAPNETFSRTLRVISVDGTRDIASPEVRSAIDRGLAEFAGRFVLLNKTKSVVSTHATEEEAKEAARAQARRSGRASTVSDKGISVVAAERTGADRRMPGEDISSDRLRDTFKFKGVNFGNWMKGDANTKERQLHLNHAYDAFLDLADVLGVPPEAMSLDGMLGVAIGAQGHGGNAAAHFVPGVNEINLTRESGAGSLAHEWGHALDHYFARQAGLTRATGPFLTSHLKAAAGSELRPEILDKFKTIVQAMHKRPMTPEEADAKRQEGIASARRNLDGWLKNVIRGDLMDDPEVSKAIERIKSGDLGDGSVAVGRTSVVKPAIADLGKIIKEKAGRVLQRTDLSAIDSWAGKLKYLQGQNDGDAAHVPQQIVETQYFKAATSLDKDKGGKPYWSTTLEMFARAFDAFVSDTLEAKAAKNSYLSHAGRGGETVPAGGERTAINAAIQGLVDAVETKAGEDGNVLLYNVAADDNPGLSAAIEGAKAAREQMNRFREDSPVEDADSYFDIIGKVIAADKAVAAKIAEIADDGFAVMAKTRDGRMVTLTKSAQRSGKYQVTTFGKDGAPWGDTQHDTKMGAAKQFVEDVDVNTIEVADGINYNLATDTKLSPSDRAIYSMVAEGKTAAEILSFIGKASRRPFNRYLANALRSLGAASKLTLDSQGGWRFGNTSQAQRYAAAYNPKTDTVALFTARDAERHILHEFVHSQTLKAIAAGGPASLQMRALFLHIKRNGSLDGQYGMSNLDEFVAEAFSNPKFQAALKAIPAPKGSGMQNAWQWFVRAVARALGIKTAAMETALDRAMVEGAKLMRENAALSGQMDGSDRYALAWHGTPHVWAPEPGFPHGRPRLDKMGSGEGAQAYGWGWYSADSRDVATSYIGGKSGHIKEPLIGGKRIDELSPQLLRKWEMDTGGKSYAFFDQLRMSDDPQRTLDFYKSGGGPLGSVAAEVEAMGVRAVDAGALYRLDIPDDVMPNLLDWDKPLSDQTPEVRKALGVTSGYSFLNSPKGRLTIHGGSMTGLDLYQELESFFADSKKKASEYLASIGIVGTRYLDGNSRSDGAGTHNYVIWDQPTLNRIALLERNGEKLDAIREADAARYNVEPLPDTITINGTERPTANSNGKPIAQDEASIRRFWEWFGESKVVDGQGRPLVLFHGASADFGENDAPVSFDFGRTADEDLSSGKGAYLTTSPEAASKYSEGISWGNGGQASAPNVMPVYARIEYPFSKTATYRIEDFESVLPERIIEDAKESANPGESFLEDTQQAIDNLQSRLDDLQAGYLNDEVADDYRIDESDYDNEDDYQAAIEEAIEREIGDAERSIERYEGEIERAWATAKAEYSNARLSGAEIWDAIKEDLPEYADWKNERQLFGGDSASIEMDTEVARILFDAFGFDGVKRTDKFPIKTQHTVYIANNSPTQIKSATGNSGQFSDNPDIRYNIATDWYDNNAPQSVKSVVANALRSDAKTSWLTPFNTQYHKAEKWAKEGRRRFKTVFDLVQRFLGDVSKFAVLSQNAAPTLFHEWRTLADVRDTLSSGDMLGKQHRADVAAIASPLYEGTLYGGGNPMSGIRWSDAQLRDKFKLSDRQIKLYNEALAAVNVSMDELAKSIVSQHAKANNVNFDSNLPIKDMAEAVVRRLGDAKQDLEALLDPSEQERIDGEKADLLDMDMGEEADKLQRDFDRQQKEAEMGVARIEKTIEDIKGIVSKNQRLQAAGYFPLMRFGKHTVTAKDADGKVQFFGMYEGLPLVPRSGQYEANKVAAELRAAFPEWTVETGIKNDEKYKLYQGLNIEAIQLFAEHMDKESLEPFQEFIRLATNNRSAQRRLLHRQGTPGFDKDVRRTLAQFMVSNARAASSNYHVQDMLRAAADAEKDGGDIGSEAVKLVNYVRNPTEEAQALRGFLFFQFLGGSLASAAINLTQTPMMTLPFLSQFEPAGALIQRLTQAAKLAVQKVEKIPNQRLREALERAEMDGVTAPQEIYQLTATAANNIFAGSRLASALLRGWGAPFAMAEGFNRRIAFISAFQIAEKMGAADLLAKTGFRDAFAFAEDAVNQTQGIYNKGNRMNVGRGTAGSVLMTFKQYSIMYLELLKRLPTKQRAIMVGLLVLAAGGGGLPGVEDAEDLWDTIGQWLGFASNSKRTLRNTLTEWMGRDAADMAMNGLLSRVGIDLHGRMGMHNLIPGTGIMKQSSVDKGRDLEEFFGPAASVVKSVGDALESLATGHPDRAAMALAPSAVRNLAQGAKMADKGYSEDAKGRKGVPVNGAESGAKMIGFNPKSVADYGAIKRDLAQDQRLVGVKREEFSSAIADAIIADDPAARAEAMQSLLAWNAENPSARVTITSAAIAKRVRDARAEGATRMLRSLPKGMRSQAREEFAQ